MTYRASARDYFLICWTHRNTCTASISNLTACVFLDVEGCSLAPPRPGLARVYFVIEKQALTCNSHPYLMRPFCQYGTWKKAQGSSEKKQFVEGVCAPPHRSSTTCTLMDSSWICMLTGARAVGEQEFGRVYLSAGTWYLTASRQDWAVIFYWGCFK